MLNGWLEAEKMVMAGQSYSINGQTVTRANLSDIRKSVQYWQGQVNRLERQKKGRGRTRIIHVIPTD